MVVIPCGIKNRNDSFYFSCKLKTPVFPSVSVCDKYESKLDYHRKHCLIKLSWTGVTLAA